MNQLPNVIGKTAARACSLRGISSLDQVAHPSQKELLAVHGVGPEAIAILGGALAGKGRH